MPGLLKGLAAIALACGLGACQAEPSVILGGERYTVEIADDNEERRIGLMFRDQMPQDHGMLFIFERPRPQSFWMKNTRISLDILYFDAERRLVSLHRDVPPCRTRQCPSYPSGAPAQYVLELNAGETERLGVDVGAIIEFDLD